ncbi:MAG: hypothetical protein U0625_13820 [Phycisphaerales bacterium]
MGTPRTHGRGLRRWSTRLALAAAACAVPLVLTGCDSGPQKAAELDALLVGSWRSPVDGSVLNLTATGLYTLTMRDQPRAVVGSYEWAPKTRTITLSTRHESPLCADDLGIYLIAVSGQTLDAQVQRDTCERRKSIFSRPFTRVSPPAAPAR